MTSVDCTDRQSVPSVSTRSVRRRRQAEAIDDRLFFAQVREDSALDVAAVVPTTKKHVVVVTSGGGTALAMLAAGARRVTAVDTNATQNDIAELQAVALAQLGSETAVAYLGGRRMKRRERLRLHDRTVREHLTPHARATWDQRRTAVAGGVLRSGVTERFLGILAWILGHLVIPGRAQRALLACQNVAEQRRVVRSQWDNRRWRIFFRVLLNKRVCQKVYSPAFFEHVEPIDFADQFRRAVEHGLSNLPVGDNYFLHQLLEGEWRPTCVPPHLTPAAAAELRDRIGDLELVDGDLLSYLRSQPDGSVDGLCLSNICEWLSADVSDALLQEIVRVSAPDATLVIRNFVGWTEIPESLQDLIAVDWLRSDQYSQRDRSLVQRRMLIARVRPS
jgi:S-adenosylmethionine:diacylglycerol 3-amino-3-carboxypropyl transferase